MKGNFHVQFLGEGVAATSPPYPTPGWATTQVYPAHYRGIDWPGLSARRTRAGPGPLEDLGRIPRKMGSRGRVLAPPDKPQADA